jgi:hypothetical protein
MYDPGILSQFCVSALYWVARAAFIADWSSAAFPDDL